MNMRKMEHFVSLIYKIKQHMNIDDCLGFGKLIPPDNIIYEVFEDDAIYLKGNCIEFEDYFNNFSFKKSRTRLYKDMKDFYSDEPYNVDQLIDYLIDKFTNWLEKRKETQLQYLIYYFNYGKLNDTIEMLIEMEQASTIKLDNWSIIKNNYLSLKKRNKL